MKPLQRVEEEEEEGEERSLNDNNWTFLSIS